METDFWIERWKNNEIGFHQETINRHLEEYWRHLDVPAGSTVFVPLCGKSLDMLWLVDQGYRVLGIELSHAAVESFFRENELAVEVTEENGLHLWKSQSISIYEGDFFSLAPKQLSGVSAVFDRASLIALPDWMRCDYVEALKKLLPPSMGILLITLVYDQEEMQGPPFSVSADEVGQLYREWCDVEEIASIDALTEEPGFRKRGLTSLQEKVFALSARQPDIGKKPLIT